MSTKPIDPNSVGLGRDYEIRGEDVLFRNGGYYIGAELWNDRISSGRRPQYDHDFSLGERVDERGVPSQYGRVRATCNTCGESRLVFRGVEMRVLNSMWCVKPKSWFRRYFGL